MTKKNNEITLPSVLAFERKLEVSDGLMCAGTWKNRNQVKNKKGKDLWQPIAITPRKNRSTQSAAGIKDIDKTKPNPVASGDDKAVVPTDCNTLKLSWTMRIIGNVGIPFSCNEKNFEDLIEEKVNNFKRSGLNDLAFRYAYNIVNGRFLWRNRVCAEQVEIQVTTQDEEKPLIFNAYDFSLQDFTTNKDDSDLAKIVLKINNGLIDTSGENFTSIKINAFVKLDELQEVFPSQEMNTGEKGKKLFQLNSCAAMHNVKIGNAIRTIDTWYNGNAIKQKQDSSDTEKFDVGDEKTPIAIEPYGSVTQRGVAYRPNKDDLYNLMIDWLNKDIRDDDKNYVVANLIRGGVFSKKK